MLAVQSVNLTSQPLPSMQGRSHHATRAWGRPDAAALPLQKALRWPAPLVDRFLCILALETGACGSAILAVLMLRDSLGKRGWCRDAATVFWNGSLEAPLPSAAAASCIFMISVFCSS
eukprot:scaffold1017_cov374-Prasinococcus_capsulatus_cf.AAC.19